MKGVFVDASAWIVAADGDHPSHAAVVRVMRGARGRLHTSSYVFDEVVTLCRRRYGHARAAKLGIALRSDPGIHLLRVTPEDEAEAWRLFLAPPDKTYSFTDCTSFVLMRRLGIEEAVTLDADFTREGFRSLP